MILRHPISILHLKREIEIEEKLVIDIIHKWCDIKREIKKKKSVKCVLEI